MAQQLRCHRHRAGTATYSQGTWSANPKRTGSVSSEVSQVSRCHQQESIDALGLHEFCGAGPSSFEVKR